MTLEDLLARFKPKDSQIQPSSEPAGSVPGFNDSPNSPQVFQDGFHSTSPAPGGESSIPQSPAFLQQLQQMGMNQQPQQQQMGMMNSQPSNSDERLARIEEKLKLISDKIDLMGQQVSVVWEMERRRNLGP